MFKFSSQKAILLDAILISSRAISTKNTIPSLEGILIDAKENEGLKFSSYNLEIGIHTHVPADVTEPGSAILNARLLSEIIKRLPDDIVTVTMSDDTSAAIKCGPVEYDIPALPAADFPDIPTVNPERSVAIQQNILRDMIEKTIFAVAVSDSKPVLTGLFFDVKENLLNMVAIDNFRMALRREPLETPLGDPMTFSFILPGSTARELDKILGDVEENVEITLSQKHICFKINDTTMISRLIDGEYYNYQNFIPQKGAIAIVAGTKRVSEAVERVSLIINDRLKNHIKMTASGAALKMSTLTSLGRASDEMTAESASGGDGEPLEIGFNSRFLTEALKSIDDETVCIEITSAVSPCVLRPVDIDSGEAKYLHILMPVRLK